uniref:Uncharacterized protein n=1 Tax=Rhizophora mucronata TaxID=61149 RepID=A0A2P2QZY9_RHIMU
MGLVTDERRPLATLLRLESNLL